MVDQLPQSPEEFEREFRALSQGLENIGLSPYEARAYIALVAHGYGDAETIANTAQIPRTSAYKILQSLHSKGFVISTEGRPKIFKPEPPLKIHEEIQDRIKTTFSKLELLHEFITEKGEPQLIYTISGKHKVIEKIAELLDKSTDTFIISTPFFSEILRKVDKKIENAIKRGVEVTIITAPLQRTPKNVIVIKKDSLVATDVISDKERAFMASPDLSTCGYTDNSYLAEHLYRFLQILIEKK